MDAPGALINLREAVMRGSIHLEITTWITNTYP